MKRKLTRSSVWGALVMAFALASLFQWRKPLERAAYRLLSDFAEWARSGDVFLVLLVLSVAGLAFLYVASWIARRVAAPGLGCTFDALTPEQQGFLSTQFRGGLRRLEVPPLTSRQRWFEALISLGYIERREIRLVSDPIESRDLPVTMPYEVTAAAWRELRRKLVRDASGN